MTRLMVVTGAASGIGQAIMAALTAQGDEVLGIDRLTSPGIVAVDLGQPDAGDPVLTALNGRDPDGLVNAAAVFHSGALDLTGAADWDRLYADNAAHLLMGQG